MNNIDLEELKRINREVRKMLRQMYLRIAVDCYFKLVVSALCILYAVIIYTSRPMTENMISALLILVSLYIFVKAYRPHSYKKLYWILETKFLLLLMKIKNR